MTTTPSLTDTQRIVLAELASRGDLPRSALTQAASVSHNTISRTVDVLKFRGLIADEECNRKRTKGRALAYLSITDAGRYALANPDAPQDQGNQFGGSMTTDEELTAADIRIGNDAQTIARLQSELDNKKRYSAQLVKSIDRIEARQDGIKADNTRLRGEAKVLRDLLLETLPVIETVRELVRKADGECDDALMLLDSQIKQALRGAV